MKRLLFPIILFLLLVSEGVAIELLPSFLSSTDILISAHWVFVFLIMILMLYDTDETFFSIIYAVIFGLLIDVVYTGVLGVYMFVYPFTLYLMHLVKRFLQTNFYMVVLVLIFSLFITEVLLFLIYSIVGSVEMVFTQFLLHRFLPTVIGNVLFLIPLYLLAAKKLNQYRQEHLEK